MYPFTRLEEEMAEVAAREGGRLAEAGRVDGYPILWLEFPGARPDAPRIWMSAGIHGEEPGSVEGCRAFLREALPRWRRHFAFTVLPCLSPYGWERGWRHDARGRDPNRLFRHPEEPLVASVRRALAAGPRPRFAIDMHEDSDFSAFYMYELAGEDPPFAPDAIAAVAAVGPVADGLDLDPPIRQGLVVREEADGEALRARLTASDAWPIAFLLHEAAGHTVTLETPVKRPLAERARMQVVAAEACLSRLLTIL
jgi:hypothetical protein